MQHPRHRRATSGGMLALALLLGAGTGPVQAGFGGIPDPVLSGKVGPWSLRDTEESPSVICTYGDETESEPIESVAVRAPRVRWPNTSPRPGQKGKVRWRIALESSEDNGASFQPTGIGRTKTATATETTRAPFTRQVLEVSGELEPSAYFRVKHRVRWIRPDGSVRGTVVFWSNVYDYVPEIIGVQFGGCGYTR